LGEIEMIINHIDEGIATSKRIEGEVVRETISFNDFKPYFYATSFGVEYMNDQVNSMLWIKDRFGGVNVRILFEKTDAKSLEGEELVKVTWTPSRPEYTRKVADFIGMQTIRGSFRIRTYEADVRYHYRYAVDEIEDMPEYKMRKMYWDMEWMQGGEHDGAITCIVAYDNYDDKYTTFSWFPNDSSETLMLVDFLNYIQDKDPDMLISWFGWKFDLPKLLERMVLKGIDARLLSPFQEVSGIGWKDMSPTINRRKVENFSPIYQPIKGRICFPLDLAFERQWNDAQRGTLPSMALDYVAETILGEKKLVSDKFPDKNEFFQRGWLEDTETYLEYARIDVELLVKIDESNHVSESVLALQRLLKAPFDACFYASNMGSIYFMRHADWKAPTGEKGERVSYDGAMVYDPLSEGTNGLHHNVAAFDFAQLYPSMIIARNISWETISKTPTELCVNIKTPKDFSPVTEVDMRYFRTDKVGLLPKAVMNLRTLRQEYKENMKKYPEDYVMWNNNQMAVKRLMASFYGIIAYQGFGWANVDLAASITASAREAIREAARLAKEMNQ
jgi:DNA polymerase elongation subunit (family B)